MGQFRPTSLAETAARHCGDACARCSQPIAHVGRGKHHAKHLRESSTCEYGGCQGRSHRVLRHGAVSCFLHLGEPAIEFVRTDRN